MKPVHLAYVSYYVHFTHGAYVRLDQSHLFQNLKVSLTKHLTPPPPPPPFHWTTIPQRSWRSRIFSKIIPNRRGSRVGSQTIWGLAASSTLPLRFYNASLTPLLHLYDPTTTMSMLMAMYICSCDLAMTLAMELQGASTALLLRIVAESPSSGMGV